jgi:hypothetical protein
MTAGQDWCLQCGAGAPGSLGSPGWRPTLTVLGAVLALVLGAAAAAYAALSEGPAKDHVVTTTVAQTAPPSSTVSSTPSSTLPSNPGGAASTPKAAKSRLGLGGTKPPKIPLTALTPKASEKTTPGSTGTGTGGGASEPTKTGTTTTPSSTTGTTNGAGTGQTGETSEESQQTALVLDTNAAQTYNPYEYPASWFGDPSQAIDDDPATAWTAQVNPTTAPAMAEGLVIDLKSKQKVSVLQLLTTTPGMTVQVYGAAVHNQPTSITDPAWVPLSKPKLVKKRKLRLALRHSTKAFTFIALWISKAPKSAIGTPEAPGHVSIDELELFPAR